MERAGHATAGVQSAWLHLGGQVLNHICVVVIVLNHLHMYNALSMPAHVWTTAQALNTYPCAMVASCCSGKVLQLHAH
jgi:hypothetical protein